jgi:hypothetical protein
LQGATDSCPGPAAAQGDPGAVAPTPQPLTPHLHIKLHVQRQRVLGEEVGLEEGEEAVEPPPRAALLEVHPAGGQRGDDLGGDGKWVKT